MAARKSGLGRGLDALIPVDHPDAGFANIPIDHVSPNAQQPRDVFDEEAIESLAASIREVGLLQPIVVRSGTGDGEYTLVAGERRLRAAKRAGLAEIPAVIRPEADAQTDLTEALIENIHREDLNPLEQAAAYRQLMEDFGLTQEETAQKVGKARVTITNTLRLLQLPAPIQGMVSRGELAAGHARALLGLEDQAYARHVAAKAVDEGWSVRQVEEAVRARNGAQPPRAREPRAPRPAAVIELEERLAEQLGSKVTIDYTGKAGKLVVRFTSLDDLERIYKRFMSG